MKFTKKDNLIIIGAGKIAYSLAPALSESGYKIKIIISNKLKRTEELAGKLKTSDYTDNPETIKLKKGTFIKGIEYLIIFIV
jgi:prephenate dehydrogenase